MKLNSIETVTVTEVLDELFGLDVGFARMTASPPSPGDLVVQVVQPGEVLAGMESRAP
jgi:hypothetical protein